jgi:hypothetical protein
MDNTLMIPIKKKSLKEYDDVSFCFYFEKSILLRNFYTLDDRRQTLVVSLAHVYSKKLVLKPKKSNWIAFN